ncbi:hypothetical protein HDU76_007306, partial [Blyttiomyces sp. JEL0837]
MKLLTVTLVVLSLTLVMASALNVRGNSEVALQRKQIGTLPGVYFIELQEGCNPEDISTYLRNKGIEFTVRTQIQSKYMCGGSVEVQGGGSEEMFADLPGLVS